MSMTRQERRELWFNLGANAASKVFPQLNDVYVCPLCSPPKAFTRLALAKKLLTFEHAPPESLGGREVALTCIECNVCKGSKLDKEAVLREAELDFALGTMQQPRPVVLTIDGTSVNALVRRAGSNEDISVSMNKNRPEAFYSFANRVEVGNKSQQPMHLELTLPTNANQRRAHLSWLRAAYLASFSALGYRYIFSRQLRSVREQLREADSNVLRVFSATIPSSPTKTRRLLHIQQPDEWQSIAVIMGRQVVYLPSALAEHDIYRFLSEESRRSNTISVRPQGKESPWPTRPMHQFDFS